MMLISLELCATEMDVLSKHNCRVAILPTNASLLPSLLSYYEEQPSWDTTAR